ARLHAPGAPVPRLFRQLALNRRLLALAGLHAARRHLPEEAAEDVAVLADQDDRVRVEERQHADAAGALHDAVDGRPAIRERDLIFAHADPAILVDGPRGEPPPRDARQPPTIRHDAGLWHARSARETSARGTFVR